MVVPEERGLVNLKSVGHGSISVRHNDVIGREDEGEGMRGRQEQARTSCHG